MSDVPNLVFIDPAWANTFTTQTDQIQNVYVRRDDPKIAALVEALNFFIRETIEMGECGDGGFYDGEKTLEVIQARTAIAAWEGK